MPRRKLSEETVRLVEKQRGIMQMLEGRKVSFDEALNELLVNPDKKKENDFFRL